MIGMLGASFKNASFADIAVFSTATPLLADSLMMTPHSNVHGIITVLTCNRVEIYVDTPNPMETVTAIQGILAERTSLILPTLMFDEEDTARHLFHVASGLDSLIPGEREILGQVRRSLGDAQDRKTSTPRLTRLFERALSTAKDVFTSTRLGESGRGLIDAALMLTDVMVEAEKQTAYMDAQGTGSSAPMGHVMESEEQQGALIIGTGAYAKVTHAALVRRGFTDIRAYSASGRAGHFTENHHGQIVPVGQASLLDALCDVGVVVECSGQGGIDWERVLPVADGYHQGNGSVLTVIDMALNQTASTVSVQYPHLRTVSMSSIIQYAPHDYQKDIDRAHTMVNTAVTDLLEREMSREASGVIRTMHTQMQDLVADTLNKVVPADADPQTRKLVEVALNRLMNAALHVPVMQAKLHASNGNITEYRRALETVHGVTDMETSGPS